MRFIDPDGMLAVQDFDGNWHELNENDYVNVYQAPAKQEEPKTSVVMIGGADLASGHMGISETTKEIQNGIKGAEVMAVNYDYFQDDVRDKLTEIADWVFDQSEKGNNIVIYGYSAGGAFALQLIKRLEELAVPVDLLVTVDAADGPFSDTVDRTVSKNVNVNFNIYQTKEIYRNLTSHGGPNQRVNGELGGVFNLDWTGYKGMDHGNIDEAAKDFVIRLINSYVKTEN